MSTQHKSFAKWNGLYFKDTKFHAVNKSSFGEMYVKLIINENLIMLELINANPKGGWWEKFKEWDDLNIRRWVVLFKTIL